MTWLPTFLMPVRFREADAAAYREKAESRDNIVLRLFAIFLLLAMSSRSFIEWNLYPDAVGASVPYRIGTLACVLALFALSFHRRNGRFFHGAVGVGIFLLSILSALINAQAPIVSPFAMTGVWMLVFLLGTFSFGTRQVVLVALTGVVSPITVLFVSSVTLDSLATLVPLVVVTITMALTMSYALEQHWRRAFQRDLDLAASHRKLAEAYATLKETQAQLVMVEKTAALGRLVANVAHRINTPIGNVVAVASHLDDSLRRFTDTMLQGGMRRSDLTAFVDAIAEGNGIVLANAQQTAGLIDLFKRLVVDAGEKPGCMDVVTLLTGIRPSLEAMLAPGVALAVDASPGLAIMAQWHVMEAVAGELVRNAVTHAFSGGRSGTVTIRARAATDGGVEIQVIDDGRGIPCEHLEHVFDPFYTDGNIGGGQHGLGLSVVHNAVVGPLGGRIDIDSREGQGTTVTIRLPAAMNDGMEIDSGEPGLTPMAAI